MRNAVVLSRITGDLAFKKRLPPLQATVKRGRLDAPRAKESVEAGGEVAFYVDGDCQEFRTYARPGTALGSSERPLHYLAIAPSIFEPVIGEPTRTRCSHGARAAIDQPFGRAQRPARELDRRLLAGFSESAVFRIDHYLGNDPVPKRCGVIRDVASGRGWYPPRSS